MSLSVSSAVLCLSLVRLLALSLDLKVISAMLWEDLLSCVPPFIQEVTHSLCKLCQRIETLSFQSLLHPSKCRCLARSYSVLLRYVLTLTSQPRPSSSLSSNLPALLSVLLHTLQQGERFIQDCSDRRWKQWVFFSSARKQRQLINKAIAMALSTEIFDVHLHDLVWCISTLIWVLADHGNVALDVRIQADEVDALLKETWAVADEEGDVRSMQELFNKIGASGHKQICDLICHRLSQSTSKAQLNLSHAAVPTYLWMDPHGFEHMNDRVLGSNDSTVVFETRWMGGRFACKHFHRPGYEFFFANEAVLQARLQHANVVHLVCCIKKASAEGESRSLVMELMDKDLGSLIAKRRSDGMDAPFSLLAGVDLMLQIAKGMEYLHDLGIMHRDLKSFNILVSHSQHASYLNKGGDHLIAKIADFGTSKVNYDTSLFTTKRVGTSIWRAPEVLDEEDEAKYTKKADVYSFAIVCSEILTGLPPDELLPCNLRSELPKLLKEGRRPKIPSSCPPAIASYIEKCWHGDASERPTFKQICRVFRFFKACLLLREREMLASPLQDDMLDFEELQKTAGGRQSEGNFYHPVLDIPSEMHIFSSIRRKQKFNKRSEHQRVKQLLLAAQVDSTPAQEFSCAVDLTPAQEFSGAMDLTPAQPFSGVSMEIMLSQLYNWPAEVLGEGSLGIAYKCELEDGSFVVVKRLRKGIIVGNKLKQQLSNMVKLKHVNLVPLLAYSYTEDEDLLVTEYMTNRVCLCANLGGSRILDWDTRVRVARGVANGVNYLHEHGYIHGSIKSSNILLTNNREDCVLSDYGIAWMVDARTAILDYLAPDGNIAEKTDVHNYGMLLLELLTGENIGENGYHLSVWAESREEQIQIFKSLLFRYPHNEEEMVEMLHIALARIGPYYSRPAMKQVVKMVEELKRT